MKGAGDPRHIALACVVNTHVTGQLSWLLGHCLSLQNDQMSRSRPAHLSYMVTSMHTPFVE